MINKNLVVLYLILLFISFSSINVFAITAPKMDVGDTYNFDESTFGDQVAFENYDFDFQVTGLESVDDPDLVCFDWDVYGVTNNGEDYCIYTNNVSKNQCVSCWLIDVPISKMDQKSSLTAEINDQVCDGCEFDTSNTFGDSVQANVYYYCYQCASSDVFCAGTFYSVINPRQYLCKSNGNDQFIARGEYQDSSTGSLTWIEYDQKYCSDTFDHNLYDVGCSINKDKVNDNTGTTVLSSPCAIKDGEFEQNACFSNSDCISNNCGGEMNLFSGQCSDGSDNYQIDMSFYKNSCIWSGFSGLGAFSKLSYIKNQHQKKNA